MQHTLIIQALFSLKHNNHHESKTNTFIHQFSNQEISQHTQPFYVIQISKWLAWCDLTKACNSFRNGGTRKTHQISRAMVIQLSFDDLGSKQVCLKLSWCLDRVNEMPITGPVFLPQLEVASCCCSWQENWGWKSAILVLLVAWQGLAPLGLTSNFEMPKAAWMQCSVLTNFFC